MIRKLEQSHDNILGFSAAGDISEEDYTRAASLMRDVLAQHDDIRLLFRLEDISAKSFFTGMDERIDFVKTHGDDIQRIAVVSDGVAEKLFSFASGLFSDIEIDNFDPADEEKAWAWLS